MLKLARNKKGAALLLVLATILIVTILANVALNFVLNQSRLSTHQVHRIQAYYAAIAGMNLTIEMLRTNTWSADPGVTKYACINGCVDSVTPNYSVADTDIPFNVQITIGPREAALNRTTALTITTDFTPQS